jgi:imidazolonepropionase-like amidohydrolase
MPAEKALQAITLEAARVSGVADRVGSLEVGKRADFVVLDRDPFDARTRPLAVYCGGRRVYRRTADRPPADIIAVRAGRVLTMAGRTLDRATVLIENGKIIDIGSAVTVPSTARVIEVEDGVVTPGFIDTASHVGLHTDRLTVTPSAVSPPAGSRRPQPRPARRPGTRPRRRTPRGFSVKLEDHLVDVIQPGDPGFAALLRAGVTSVILTPPGTAVARLAAIKLGARNRDELVLRRMAGIRYPMKLSDSASRKSAAGKLEATLKRAKAYLDKQARYEKDLAAYRKAKAEARDGDEAKEKAAAKLEEPKKPKEDPNHEAWKAVLEKRAALVVPVRREDTITAALEVFKKYDLKPILVQATEAHRVLAAVKTGAAGLLAGPPFVVLEPDGTPVFNARRLSDAGVPVAFYSGGTSGAKFLPLHAAYAHREGLSRDAALEGLTSAAARLFGIDDRVGSLEIGKDGDLVVFSGDPFDLAARVQVVVAAGHVVYDARKGVR